ARLMTQAGKFRIDAWFGHPALNQAGAFDDRGDSHERFWGAIVHHDAMPQLAGFAGELFLFVRDRDRAVYQQGVGSDDRRTVGMHFTRTAGRADVALQLAHQFGEFAGSHIDANGVALDVGWRVGRGDRVRLGLSGGYAEGDRDTADRTLQT